MTKDVTRRWFPALLILCAATAVEAQELDYIDEDSHRTTGAVWTEVSAVKVLPYDLSLGLDAGFRTDDWFNEASRYDFGLGLSWKPGKHWKFGVGYTFIMKHYPIETAKKNGQARMTVLAPGGAFLELRRLELLTSSLQSWRSTS